MSNLDEMRPFIPERGELPVEWVDGPTIPPIQREGVYKIHHDGGHYIGHLIEQTPYFPPPPKSRIKLELNKMLDEHIQAAVSENYKGVVLQNKVVRELQEKHPEVEKPEEVVAQRVKERYHNLYNRLKRFRWKANLNRWNYFVTFTYADDKMDEATFRKKLKRCLSNMAQNHKWRYIGVFERGSDTDRVHFHAIMYIPKGEMVGELYEKKDYSTEKHEMRITHQNTFFEERFGRNDFDAIDENILKFGNAFNYLLKYVGKQNERIIYSRGIKETICMKLEDKDIACGMIGTEKSYVLFDGKIDWERDVMRYRYEQESIFDDD